MSCCSSISTKQIFHYHLFLYTIPRSFLLLNLLPEIYWCLQKSNRNSKFYSIRCLIRLKQPKHMNSVSHLIFTYVLQLSINYSCKPVWPFCTLWHLCMRIFKPDCSPPSLNDCSFLSLSITISVWPFFFILACHARDVPLKMRITQKKIIWVTGEWVIYSKYGKLRLAEKETTLTNKNQATLKNTPRAITGCNIALSRKIAWRWSLGLSTSEER